MKPTSIVADASALPNAQLRYILGDIAMLAQAIARLATAQVEDGSGDFDESKALAIRAMANQAGWLADLGGVKIGAGEHVGGAEQWMLPPMYHASGEARHG